MFPDVAEEADLLRRVVTQSVSAPRPALVPVIRTNRIPLLQRLAGSPLITVSIIIVAAGAGLTQIVKMWFVRRFAEGS